MFSNLKLLETKNITEFSVFSQNIVNMVHSTNTKGIRQMPHGGGRGLDTVS
jgi:hypothetical protein